jgi:hypothetical protein
MERKRREGGREGGRSKTKIVCVQSHVSKQKAGR